VRELVLQPGAGSEHDAGEPGGDEAFRARLAVAAVREDARQMGGEAVRRVARERHQERRAVADP
jgi:hypothetical protein